MPLPAMVGAHLPASYYPQSTPIAGPDDTRCETVDPILGRCILRAHQWGRHHTAWGDGFEGHW